MSYFSKLVALVAVAAVVGIWMGGGMSHGQAAAAVPAADVSAVSPAAEGAGPEFETTLPRAAF